jgi:hypothetical protein
VRHPAVGESFAALVRDAARAGRPTVVRAGSVRHDVARAVGE